VLLQREIGRLRTCAITLGVAVLGCAAFAVPGRAAELRHYEQVSPADKGDGDIIAEGTSTIASDAGDAAAFESRMVFGDAIGSGVVGRTTYVARRGAGGWSTHSVTPMPRPDTSQLLFVGNRVEVFSDDLSNALVWAYDLPAVADDTPLQENLYAEDTLTGALRTISKTQQDPLGPFDFISPDNSSGYSADAKHMAFTLFTQMLPEAAPGVPNVYKWDDGVLSVAGLLPDGTVPPAGATLSPTQVRGTMSADGSRLVFMASPDGSAPSQLYLHVNGRPSVWVSQPELSSNDQTPPSGIQFEGMTSDGNNIFFVSDTPLLDADTTAGPDEYRFTYSADAASNNGNLTLVTRDGQALNDPFGFGGTLVGMSDDARSAYLHEADGTLKLWQEGVPGLTTVDPSAPRRGTNRWLTLMAWMPTGLARVSPDGNWLAYIKDGQMYFYDRGSESLTCVSCPSDASVEPFITESGRRYYTGIRPRFLSEDGKVFFTSTGSFVAGDTNGVADVYEYDGPTRTFSLLSSGKGSEPANFADASQSGDDVFIVTRQQLVKSDRDDYVDVYDVRVGAAPPEQPLDTARVCDGDACQGALSSPPADDAVGSLSLEERAAGHHARLTVRHRVTFSGTAGVLSVKLGAAGRIAWSGRGLVSGALRRGSAGTVKLRVRLAKRARVRFHRLGHYATTLHLAFHPVRGGTETTSVLVRFKARKRTGR
jgi:hypothetical protein